MIGSFLTPETRGRGLKTPDRESEWLRQRKERRGQSELKEGKKSGCMALGSRCIVAACCRDVFVEGLYAYEAQGPVV